MNSRMPNDTTSSAPSTFHNRLVLFIALSDLQIADSPRHGAMVRPGAAVRLDRDQGEEGAEAEVRKEKGIVIRG
jgi:hypothetical protein